MAEYIICANFVVEKSKGYEYVDLPLKRLVTLIARPLDWLISGALHCWNNRKEIRLRRLSFPMQEVLQNEQHDYYSLQR